MAQAARAAASEEALDDINQREHPGSWLVRRGDAVLLSSVDSRRTARQQYELERLDDAHSLPDVRSVVVEMQLRRQEALDVSLATQTPEPQLSPVFGGAGGVVGTRGEDGAGTLSPLTFYVCIGAPDGYQDGYCGDGSWPYPGVAACGWMLPKGTRFTIDGDDLGRTYTCDDVGAYTIGQWPGFEYTVEPWFRTYEEGRAWRDQFGEYVTIRIIE